MQSVQQNVVNTRVFGVLVFPQLVAELYVLTIANSWGMIIRFFNRKFT
jgi:hypothetical protein